MSDPLRLRREDTGELLECPPGAATVVGRTAGADIVIDHGTMSRRHARFSDEMGVWTVEDAESTSGTWLDDAPVHERTQLRAGDRVRMGHVVLVVVACGEGPPGRAVWPAGPSRYDRPPGARATLRLGDDRAWSAPASGVDGLLDALHARDDTERGLLATLRPARHGGTADLGHLDRAMVLRLLEIVEHQCLHQIIYGLGSVRGADREETLDRLIPLCLLLRADPRAAKRPPLALADWEVAGLVRTLAVAGQTPLPAFTRAFLGADPAWTEAVLFGLIARVPGAEAAVAAGLALLPEPKRGEALRRMAGG